MKLSVGLIAYNHEPFIEQSVSSILAQRTNFDFEIVCGADLSTDRTSSILTRLQEQHPGKIRLLTTDRNLGMIQNYVRTYQACQGEYVALLDGDDYWSGEDKLQKQIDFLDQHPDFAITFHSVLKVYEDESRQPKVIRPADERSVYDLDDLLTSMFIPTCSAVFRNGLIDEFPPWSASLKMLDWLIFVLVARYGKIGYIDDVMAVYRVHSSGWWSSMESSKRLMANIGFFEQINPYLKFQYSKTIQTTLKQYWRKLMDELYDLAILQDSDKAAKDRIDAIASSVREFTSMPADWNQELWERIYCYFLMTNFDNANYAAAWSNWLKLMKNDPSLLWNRGLFLIGMESVFDGRWRSLIQRFTRSARSNNE
jgi:glycosyltransferase involved in cell wall biosynthesis